MTRRPFSVNNLSKRAHSLLVKTAKRAALWVGLPASASLPLPPFHAGLSYLLRKLIRVSRKHISLSDYFCLIQYKVLKLPSAPTRFSNQDVSPPVPSLIFQNKNRLNQSKSNLLLRNHQLLTKHLEVTGEMSSKQKQPSTDDTFRSLFLWWKTLLIQFHWHNIVKPARII